MMPKPSVLFFVPLLILGACGKPQEEALRGESGAPPQQLRSIEDDGLESANLVNGTLHALSDYDLRGDPALLEAGLPFLEEAGPEKSFSTFRHSSTGSQKVKVKNKAPVTVNVHSNLVFRAIHQIPPKEAIRGVKAFRLKLSGVRIHAKEKDKVASGQSLCLLDGRICLGEEPPIGAGGNPGANSKFWTGAEVHSGDFLGAASLEEIATTEDGGKVFSTASGQLEIDLLALFQLTPVSAIDFVSKHSNAYSAVEAGWRKFRFSAGDRISADGGELVLEFDSDLAKVPEDYEKRLPSPLHGASDTVNVGAKRKARAMKDEQDPLRKDYLRVLNQNDVASGDSKKFFTELQAYRNRIDSLQMVLLSRNPETRELSDKLKAELVASGWPEQGIHVISKVADGVGPCVGLSVKFVAEIEENAEQRKKIMEELRKEESKQELPDSIEDESSF